MNRKDFCDIIPVLGMEGGVERFGFVLFDRVWLMIQTILYLTTWHMLASSLLQSFCCLSSDGITGVSHRACRYGLRVCL